MRKQSVRYTINKIAERETEKSARQIDILFLETYVEEFNKRYKTRLKIITEV